MPSGLGIRFFEKHKVKPSDLVNHLFLPKRQPQSEELNLASIEQAILDYMCEASRETLFQHNFTKLHDTLKAWADFQVGICNAKAILENLQEGETACFYVRKQNCTIHFTKLEDKMRVITFRSSLPNQIITGTRGSLKMTYPETVDFVPVSSLLLSECFSSQLRYLTLNTIQIAMSKTVKAGHDFEETREPPFPFVMSEFLVTMLNPCDPNEFDRKRDLDSIKVFKKLRDQVNWHKCNLPFRRSGLWISVKVILQISLEEEMKITNDRIHGRAMYKIVILQILASLAMDYYQQAGATWDIISQSLVKLARRSKKLSEMGQFNNDLLETDRQTTLKQVAIIIAYINATVSKEWEQTAFPPEQSISPVRGMTYRKTEWHNDCIHKMEILTNHLNTDRIAKCLEVALVDNLKMIDPVIQTQGENLHSLLIRFNKGFSITDQDIHMNDRSIWIYQVEWFVRHELDKALDCKQIFDLLLAYTSTVFSLYGRTYSDPVYFSRMTIIVLKFVAVLDEIAMEEHPMLKMYETGIQPEMFESLLIPDKCDMILMETLQAYFVERNSNAEYNSWLDKSSLTSRSFSVRFAQSNLAMKQLKNKILRDSEQKIRQKIEEIQSVRQKCYQLKIEIDKGSCSYTWNSYWQRNDHNSNCYLCSIKSKLESLRKSVVPYQLPLPPAEFLRDAVVFELCVPKKIACLRDSVCILLNEILRHRVLTPEVKPKSIRTKWTQFHGVNEYNPANIQYLVHMGSETKDTLNSHYGQANHDVMDDEESSFILENGLNCKMFRIDHLDSAPPTPFTLQIHQAVSKDAVSYQALQFTLDENRATENEVIAKQSTCHQNISLKEFVTFGSVRCGENIQLRNLYAAVANQMLSLEKEPVVTLIMQTIWELGPGKREIHVDFEHNTNFCYEFLDLLEKLCDENATNWSNPMALLSLTLITVKILEITDSTLVKSCAASILRKFRTITEDWCNKLEALISKSSDTDKKEEKELMELLLNASICSAFTFNVSSLTNLPYIFKHSLDVTFWLKTLSRLNHLVVRENILHGNNQLSCFLKNLLRHARVTIPLNLQDYLYTLLDKDPQWNVAMHDFVCSKWQGAVNVRNKYIPTFHHSGNEYPDKKHAYQGEYMLTDNNHLVCVDILRGTFLVDGFPPSLLPETIIRHPLFRSFFHSSKFRVQRDSRTFKTIDKYCGHHFEFTESGQNLVIRQVSDEGFFIEILPTKLFENQVADDLVQKFTHWFDSKSKKVLFRRPSREEYQANIEDDTNYIMEPVNMRENRDLIVIPNEWLLRKCTGSNKIINLVSINSKGFRTITGILQKLESEQFMHVHFEENMEDTGLMPSNVTVKLWRFNMSFSLDQVEGLLYCDNYPDYYVSVLAGQSLGTLVGLKSGLVLEKRTMSEFSGKKKLFVIQHGTVNIDESGKHQAVCVVGALRNPPYFVFEVDQILHRLRPGNSKSAWLYLALLHASTSSPFLDPFTQLTGTEMAMWILQSGFVWSCSPYDHESLQTLGQIASLSPTYSYYPDHLKVMQTTVWPQGLENNSYAAYDGYTLIKEKLLSDCSRLEVLFHEKAKQHELKTNLELCERSYRRNLNMYNNVAHLAAEFIKDLDMFQSGSPFPLQSLRQANDNLTILAQSRQQQILAPYSQTVSSFIMIKERLPYDSVDNLTSASLGDWLTKNLRENWLRLYSICRNTNLKEKYEHELTMIFGALLYSGNGSLSQVLNLHNLSVVILPIQLDIPEPLRPLTKENFEPLNHKFVSDSIFQSLKEGADSPPSEKKFETYKKYQDARDVYNMLLNEQAKVAVKRTELCWPVVNISHQDLLRAVAGNGLLNCTTDCLTNINKLFLHWYSNLELKRFVEKVDELLRNLTTGASNFTQSHRRKGCNMMYKITADQTDVWVKQQSSLHDITSPMTFATFADAQIFSTGKLPDRIRVFPSSLEKRNDSMRIMEVMISQLNHHVKENNYIKASLRKAGIHVRLAPVILLRDYLLNWKKLSNKDAAYMIGCLAALWANIKRLNRLIMFKENETRFSVELTREEELDECENWNPLENPEWLLLELELDITIRSIQVDVARHMMEMPGSKNGVMQLNMGEGKTSVIAPMVVSTLASKRNMLCRVTVLNSIFATNHSLLSFAIGGFLNKKVNTIPCSRDLDISESLETIAKIYDECVRLGGVVISLPEYRLSFRLQMYNKFLQNQFDVGLKIYEIESWLRKNARDIVDESDEIFSVKYQLIYTTGKQLPIDGGNMRWTVCQKILELVSQAAGYLFDNYGPDVIEFQPLVAKESPEQFTHFRILNDKCKEEFYGLIADWILDGKTDLIAQILTDGQRQVLRKFLITEDISEDAHQELLADEGLSLSKKEITFLISGYLRRGILFAALKKRWRVECGVKIPKPGISSKLMAVPFRAKDVAAERTEFGHPDMAIVLTQLSYYYSGLSDEQLFQCFHILETAVTGPEGVYNSWIQKVPEGKITTDTIKSYNGINLQDYEQRTNHLFPVLRKHKAVVDFWLENVAFPKECRQFPGKLVTNAWDLCYDRFTHPTTGFSGTNDTSLLLPAQITQQDLKVLLETNSKMEATLKGEENEYRRTLRMGASCKEVLQYMIEDDLRVLIDAGALMLELGNEKIAGLWLELDTKIEGVVYFNDNGEMTIKVRRQGYGNREKDQLLALSSFRDRLDTCAVYLDDQHTRGTDIKLGTTSRACVTVGSGMRRDKLIQACMRMRKLGKGQSVHFYVSHEVHNKINLYKGSVVPINVHDILSWVKWNSSQFEKDGLVYWATNARNYAKNLAADDLFELSDKSNKEKSLLAKRCEDSDAEKLTKMYGTYHYREFLVNLIPKWFSFIKTKLSGGDSLLLHESVRETLEIIETQVLRKCKKHIPDKIHFHSMLEEEQEKELEPEQEEQVEKYRPPPETPLEPSLHDNILKCVTQFGFILVKDGITRLYEIFTDTSIGDIVQGSGWGNQWYASQDFIKVIQSKPGEKLDCYLRPMRYFVSFNKKRTGSTSILLLSLFEVNKLIHLFRENKCVDEATLHMFSGRMLGGQSFLADNIRLQLSKELADRDTGGTLLDDAVMAPMLIAAGNLYFVSIEEQKAFARFLGLALRPWSKYEETVYGNGGITATGFVTPNFPLLRTGTSFQRDPTKMVRGILKIRNEVLRNTDHAVQILERCAFICLEKDLCWIDGVRTSCGLGSLQVLLTKP